MTDAIQLSPQPAEDLERVLAEECDRYGLPHSLEGLLRHVYANRDAAYGAQKATIESLERERRELRESLQVVIDTAPWELNDFAFERAIERAKALLAQPAAGEERERE